MIRHGKRGEVVYVGDSKYRLWFTACLHHLPSVENLDAGQGYALPRDVLDVKITNDGRVHIFRQDALTIVDEGKGEVAFYAVPNRAVTVFSWCEAAFPRRIASEEIGDALELINRWRHDPTCKHVRAKIVVKVASTIFFLLLNTFRYMVSSVRGKKME